MKRLMIVTGLLLTATPTIAEARCEVSDFLGRWDVYGIANSYNEFVQEDEDGVEDGGEGIGLLEIGLGCSLEVDERTRSTPWRRDYQDRNGPGKSCAT
jgi:hypothetical protein